jgi:hypothetical protein
MTDQPRPDMSCVPYRRKGTYYLLTVPMLALLVAVFVYLWTFSFILALVLLSFYLTMCYFQAYCCVYQECPYVGGFCPAVMGIMPASLLAKWIYGRRPVIKSRRSFEIHALIAMVAWAGVIFFPLFWIAKLGLAFAGGYVACHAVYYVLFGLSICPACAIRDICPGGRFQNLMLKRTE